uniref:Uncharacterized protein n=1 Tax=Marseillevirus LCMAC201 TaxID=2506605 RepID=A0A481YY63_9VIRU|nr:MAG: hypothetical protein LCMAC201_03160 [Marseillevirus LCMAC201]
MSDLDNTKANILLIETNWKNSDYDIVLRLNTKDMEIQEIHDKIFGLLQKIEVSWENKNDRDVLPEYSLEHTTKLLKKCINTYIYFTELLDPPQWSGGYLYPIDVKFLLL